MDAARISDLLISYLCFIIVLTFHELGHAWMAWKRGDDTARLLGRISLNPIVHMELVGTVVLPMLGLFLSASGSALANFVIGWGKPVPVDPRNLRNRPLDGSLIALAGPAMNVVIALVVLGIAKIGIIINSEGLIDFSVRLAVISMYLCVFNLLPIPPLDGSHVVRHLVGMGEEMYYNLCRWGLLMVIVVMQIPGVRNFLGMATETSLMWMSKIYGISFG